MTPHVTVVDHPLIASRLSILRKTTTAPEEFRRKLQELSTLLLFEASRNWKLKTITVQTPLQSCAGSELGGPVALVPILRAGLGMLEGMLHVLPDAEVGHIGLYRDEITLRPVSYYCRLPTNLAAAEVLLLDPMLATGHTACDAIALLKAQGARAIQFVCLLACAAGIEQVQSSHPHVRIITAAIDPELNQRGYIVPGLGDAGDRYFGTGDVAAPHA
ncbi:MAG: uracil phosphoribosyltransferase [Verrucomicrobiota bacterium]